MKCLRVLTLVDTGRTDITNGCALDHVADGESLDGLVLGNASGAVAAAYKFDVTASRLVAAAISSFCRLKY